MTYKFVQQECERMSLFIYLNLVDQLITDYDRKNIIQNKFLFSVEGD